VNYLAHFHLAALQTEGNRDDWLVGALLGDFIKGPLRGDWPAGWEHAIQLHRHIDALSDQHPLRRDAARLFPADYRRYAGIALDVCGDYVLSRHWSRFSERPLPAFTAEVYATLAHYQPRLPAPAARMAERLIDYDVLGIYHRWDTVTGTLARISARLRRANPLADTAVLAACLPQLEINFLAYYPELMAAVTPTQRWTMKLLNSRSST
jgi:acyl carrier protein phosphodiesterase